MIKKRVLLLTTAIISLHAYMYVSMNRWVIHLNEWKRKLENENYEQPTNNHTATSSLITQQRRTNHPLSHHHLQPTSIGFFKMKVEYFVNDYDNDNELMLMKPTRNMKRASLSTGDGESCIHCLSNIHRYRTRWLGLGRCHSHSSSSSPVSTAHKANWKELIRINFPKNINGKHLENSRLTQTHTCRRVRDRTADGFPFEGNKKKTIYVWFS